MAINRNLENLFQGLFLTLSLIPLSIYAWLHFTVKAGDFGGDGGGGGGMFIAYVIGIILASSGGVALIGLIGFVVNVIRSRPIGIYFIGTVLSVSPAIHLYAHKMF